MAAGVSRHYNLAQKPKLRIIIALEYRCVKKLSELCSAINKITLI